VPSAPTTKEIVSVHSADSLAAAAAVLLGLLGLLLLFAVALIVVVLLPVLLLLLPGCCCRWKVSLHTCSNNDRVAARQG
jgi:hypothetical protein